MGMKQISELVYRGSSKRSDRTEPIALAMALPLCGLLETRLPVAVQGRISGEPRHRGREEYPGF